MSIKLISAGIEMKPIRFSKSILTSLFLLLLAPFILTVDARKKRAWVATTKVDLTNTAKVGI